MRNPPIIVHSIRIDQGALSTDVGETHNSISFFYRTFCPSVRLADLGRPLHDTLCVHASLAEAALATLSWDVLCVNLANSGC